MKTFLRETLEFWYWAIFCTGKLQTRLNEWVPLNQVEQFDPPPDSKKNKNDNKKDDKTTDDKPTSSTFADVFWFGAKPSTRANRLLAQYILLVAISTLPLTIIATTLAGTLGLILGAGIALMALGFGPFSQSMGLISPLLCTWMYLWSPSHVHDRLRDAAVAFKSINHLWFACCISVAILGLSGLIAERYWRKKSFKLWRLVIFIGTVGSVAVSCWIIEDLGFTVIVVILGSVPLLIAAEQDGNVRHRFLAGWHLPVFITFLLATRLLGAEQQKHDSILHGASLFIAAVVISIGTIGVFSHGFARACGGRLVESLFAGAVAGIVGTFTATVAGAFFLATLTISPLSHLLVFSWVFGHAMIASGEFGGFIGIIYPITVSAHHGWWALLTLPAALLGVLRVFPDYLALTVASALRAPWVKRSRPETLIGWLHALPPYRYERVAFPIYGHARLLIAAFRADPSATLAVLKDGASALSYTIRSALPHLAEIVNSWPPHQRAALLRGRLLAVTTTEDMFAIGRNRDISLLILEPDDLPANDAAVPANFNANVSSEITVLLPDLKSVALEVGNALAQDLPVQQERGLERCISSLDRIRNRIVELDMAVENVSGWQEIVDHSQTILRDAIETRVRAVPRLELIQPFQSGTPLRPDRAHLFKGRERLAEDVVRRVHSPGRPPLVLHGPRRCGKSSLLLNLSRLVPDDLLPVYVDLQNQAMMNSEGDFCYGLVRAATRDLRGQIGELPVGDRATFQANPYPALEDWLDALISKLEGRRILLCFDEFEKLGEAMLRGKVGEPLFDEMRHMIQHREEISFVFCGAQTLDELGPKWTSYFINARPVEILYLEPNEARELLEDPDPAFDLKYEPGVVDRILDLTRCQPYLLQLIGEAMVIVAQRHDVRWIDELLLDEALDGALSAGEIYFSDLWKETTGTTPEVVAAGQTVLRLITNGRAPPEALSEPMEKALNRLLRYHVLMKRDGGYSIEIPLVARWIREQQGAEGLPQ